MLPYTERDLILKQGFPSCEISLKLANYQLWFLIYILANLGLRWRRFKMSSQKENGLNRRYIRE